MDKKFFRQVAELEKMIKTKFPLLDEKEGFRKAWMIDEMAQRKDLAAQMQK